jgi:hypothetical protein
MRLMSLNGGFADAAMSRQCAPYVSLKRRARSKTALVIEALGR